MRKLNFLYLFLIGLFFTACHSSDDAWGDWAKSNEFPGSRRVSAFCFKYGETAYIGMGYSQDLKSADKNLRDLWKFNGTTWDRLEDFPAEGRQGSVAFVIGDTAYVGAGYRRSYQQVKEDVYFNDFYKFDLKNGKWVKKAGSNTEYDITSIEVAGLTKEECSFWGGVGFAINGKGYVGTGTISENRDIKTIFAYDPQTGKWSDSGFGGDSRVGAVTFTLQGKVVLCLGNSGQNYRVDVWTFDGTTWTKKAPLSNLDGSWNDEYDRIPRTYAVAFTSNLSAGEERGYIAAGQGNGNTCWEYRLNEDRWYEVTEFPAAMNSLRVAAVGFSINQYGYITTGGSSLSVASDNSTWKFIPGIEEDDNNDY